MNVALVIAAHGDRGGDAPNAILRAHTQALSQRGIFREVYAGTLKSEDLTLEAALQEAALAGADRICIFPMFMADGYFTNKILPDRIAQAGLTARAQVLAPLGVDPLLPPLILRSSLIAAGRYALEPAATTLLLVGHGSKLGQASLEATERAACRLRQSRAFADVTTAYLEETPFLDTALQDAGNSTLVLGFFSGDGMHAGEDVPTAIARTGSGAHYAGPIGGDVEIPAIIERAVRAFLRADGIA